ncbi:O-antigen ligase family protein [Olivibacter sp. SA151]|uniref:O-antigen ligase family protein n=1 Tax=Olivibacter jilunii TaxID=985016 RepID=UPI003F158680
MKIMFKSGSKATIHSFIGIYCLLGCILSVAFDSRSFLMGYLISFCFLYIAINNITKLKKVGCLSVLGLVLCLLTVFSKKDSSLGRALIYKISSKALEENMITGIGVDQFAHKYLLFQAEYFENQKFHEKELLLADNTYFAFNDYYQLVVEIGIGAVLGLVVLVLLMLKIIKQSLKSDQHSSIFLYASIINIVSISAAAAFTHIFDRPLLCFIWLLSLIFIVDETTNRKHQRLLLNTILLSYIFVVYTDVKHQNIHSQLNEANILWEAGYKSDSLKNLRHLYPDLSDNIDFLYSFGRKLYLAGELDRAILILEKLKAIYTFNQLYLDLAKCHERAGNTDRAIEYYTKSVHMVPNRFNTRYELFNYYLRTNQIKKAIKIGRETLLIPVKIPSKFTDFYRSAIRSELIKLKVANIG